MLNTKNRDLANDLIKEAKEVLEIEASSILDLIPRIDKEFIDVIDAIYNCKGKVIVTGIGKSGIVGKKIASTFASTGTPAIYMHPSEGLHGDLGMLGREDLVMVLSNSGETEEIGKMLPVIKRFGILLVVMTGAINSSLAHSADFIIDISVKKEACPLGLAPTSSTTAALAMGDALAMVLLKKRGFKEEDFALLHPGGILGKRFLKVDELMHKGKEVPIVNEKTSMKDVIVEMTSKRLGVTGVIDNNKNLIGVITDGDLRRALEKFDNLLQKEAKDVMTTNPKWITNNSLAVEALHKMESFSITSLFVFKSVPNGYPIGIIHLHDILKAGIM